MCSQDFIWDLNEALNLELTTSIRDVLQLSVVVGANREDVRSLYRERVRVQMSHAQTIADVIVGLWGVPLVKTDFMLPPGNIRGSVKSSLQQMLENDAAEDRNQAMEYTRMAAEARSAGLGAMINEMEECAANKAYQADEIVRFLSRNQARSPTALHVVGKTTSREPSVAPAKRAGRSG